jgi:hypothetical protein
MMRCEWEGGWVVGPDLPPGLGLRGVGFHVSCVRVCVRQCILRSCACVCACMPSP